MSCRRCLAAVLVLTVAACEGELSVNELAAEELTADADPEPQEGDRTPFGTGNYDLPLNAVVKVCHVYVGLNFRTGPSTSYLILRVLTGGTRGRTLAREGRWYKLNIDGQLGWASGAYLCETSGEASPAPPPPAPSGGGSGFGISRDGIINAAKAFVHFSYWWGGARFKVGSNDYGRCHSSTYGGHTGSYGADCSGYVGKAWQLPEAMPFDQNRHPFSTYHFTNQSTRWSAISRGNAQRADAMVYNSGGAGHIMIYESGDRWGKAWTYEARGCSSGVVHNLRLIGSSYRARQRHGI